MMIVVFKILFIHHIGQQWPYQEEEYVEEKYVKEVKERSALMTEVKTLSELNQQMREDAQSLTKALKGDSKAQGNWGELILEKILENSGLIKGDVV